MLYFWLWAALYALIHFIARNVTFAAPALPFALLLYALFLILWLWRTGRFEAYRLTAPSAPRLPGALAVLCLAILPAVNVAAYGTFAANDAAILTAGTVAAEEILFRGVLLAEPGASSPVPERFAAASPMLRALVSCALFAALHTLSAVGSAGAGELALIFLYAFCAGMILCTVTFRTDSILPAAIAHYLINVSAPEETDFCPPIVVGALISLAAGIALCPRKTGSSKGN